MLNEIGAPQMIGPPLTDCTALEASKVLAFAPNLYLDSPTFIVQQELSKKIDTEYYCSSALYDANSIVNPDFCLGTVSKTMRDPIG